MSRLDFLITRSCQSEFGCAADEKLFTVAAAFNRPRDPCDPFLLCASNPLGGRALWVAQRKARAARARYSTKLRFDEAPVCSAASTGLTLFRFGRWRGNGNSKNVAASR
jgi:hypothetical protein